MSIVTIESNSEVLDNHKFREDGRHYEEVKLGERLRTDREKEVGVISGEINPMTSNN